MANSVPQDWQLGVEALAVEAGKTYYYEVKYLAGSTQYGTHYHVEESVAFALLGEDEGKYRVKVSDLNTWTVKTK